LRGSVLPSASRTGGTNREHGAAPSSAPGLPTARVRSLRVLWTRPDGQLVEGAERGLRLLPLPPSVSFGGRDKGETRGVVRRLIGAAAAVTRLHAAAEGIRAADLESAEGGCAM